MRTGIAVPSTALPNPVRVGEGPHWDHDAGRLHWVDILAGTIHTSDPATGQTKSITVPTLIGAAVPRRSGGFVAATREGFATVDAHGTLDTRLAILSDGARMNDAKCDSNGRLWAGSTAMKFTPGDGKLHVLLPDWTTHVALEGLTLPNGLGWSPDSRTFYLVDTIEGELFSFAVDQTTTELSQRRSLFRFPAEMGMPDGLTVDSAGCIWVAMWGGDRVVRISPDGRLLTEIRISAHQLSSCAFGGEHLDELYVTSAREGLALNDDSPDGSVFVVHDLGATGMRSKVFAG